VTDDATLVLVVENDANIVDLVQANLLARGFAVIVSRTGADVGELVDMQRPDVVLLDLMLPAADGFDLCREIRERSSVGIIVVSARRGEQDKVRALNLGADDYLTKPFGIDELLARITALLRRSPVGNASALRTVPPGSSRAVDAAVWADSSSRWRSVPLCAASTRW
jgi:two-component system KDP operon response regulator KdpE